MPITINGNGAISGLGDIDGHDLETATLVVSGDTTIAPQAVGRATLFVDDSTNSVGINTTTPAASVLLEVADGTDPIVSLNNTGNGEVRLGCTAAGGYIGTESNHPFNIEINSSPAISVLTNGNVGINTTTPTARLDINQPGTYGLRVGGNGGGGDYHLEIGQRSANGSPGLNATGLSTSLVFSLNDDEVGRFDPNGRLRITANNTNNNTGSEVINSNAEQRNQYGFYRIDGIENGQTVGSLYHMEYTTGGNNVRRMGFFGLERATDTSGDQRANFIMELCPDNGSNGNVGQGTPNTNTQAFRFNYAGQLQFLKSNGGIIFPGGTTQPGATTTSKFLDDYEEGSFTPIIKDTNGSGGNIAPSSGAGNYIKIGSMCYITCRINNIDTSGLNNATMFVHGMPFVSASVGYGIGSVLMAYINFNGQVDARWLDNRTYAYFDDMVSGQLFTNLTRDDFINTNSRIEFNVITQCN